MRWTILLLATVASLTGCTTIVDEKTTTAVIQRGFNAGEKYTIRQRTLQGPQGTYQQTSVVYKGVSAVCRIDSPRDCALAAEALASRSDFGGLGTEF